ncbi:hypothetical protein SNEBB_004760 [Seison nebaliae]|nr:hypothetical protein SNEBB_004760 [Seison nebaliae]
MSLSDDELRKQSIIPAYQSLSFDPSFESGFIVPEERNNVIDSNIVPIIARIFKKYGRERIHHFHLDSPKSDTSVSRIKNISIATQEEDDHYSQQLLEIQEEANRRFSLLSSMEIATFSDLPIINLVHLEKSLQSMNYSHNTFQFSPRNLVTPKPKSAERHEVNYFERKKPQWHDTLKKPPCHSHTRDMKKSQFSIEFSPSIVIFDEFEIGRLYEKKVVVRNRSTSSKMLRIRRFPTTSNFVIFFYEDAHIYIHKERRVTLKCGSTKEFTIQFFAKTLAGVIDFVEFSYGDAYHSTAAPALVQLKLIAKLIPPILTLPTDLSLPPTLLYGKENYKRYVICNVGGSGRFTIVPCEEEISSMNKESNEESSNQTPVEEFEEKSEKKMEVNLRNMSGINLQTNHFILKGLRSIERLKENISEVLKKRCGILSNYTTKQYRTLTDMDQYQQIPLLLSVIKSENKNEILLKSLQEMNLVQIIHLQFIPKNEGIHRQKFKIISDNCNIRYFSVNGEGVIPKFQISRGDIEDDDILQHGQTLTYTSGNLPRQTVSLTLNMKNLTCVSVPYSWKQGDQTNGCFNIKPKEIEVESNALVKFQVCFNSKNLDVESKQTFQLFQTINRNVEEYQSIENIPLFEFNIVGECSSPILEMDPPILSFGPQIPLNMWTKETLIIRNSGKVPATVLTNIKTSTKLFDLEVGIRNSNKGSLKNQEIISSLNVGEDVEIEVWIRARKRLSEIDDPEFFVDLPSLGMVKQTVTVEELTWNWETPMQGSFTPSSFLVDDFEIDFGDISYTIDPDVSEHREIKIINPSNAPLLKPQLYFGDLKIYDNHDCFIDDKIKFFRITTTEHYEKVFKENLSDYDKSDYVYPHGTHVADIELFPSKVHEQLYHIAEQTFLMKNVENEEKVEDIFFKLLTNSSLFINCKLCVYDEEPGKMNYISLKFIYHHPVIFLQEPKIDLGTVPFGEFFQFECILINSGTCPAQYSWDPFTDSQESAHMQINPATSCVAPNEKLTLSMSMVLPESIFRNPFNYIEPEFKLRMNVFGMICPLIFQINFNYVKEEIELMITEPSRMTESILETFPSVEETKKLKYPYVFHFTPSVKFEESNSSKEKRTKSDEITEETEVENEHEPEQEEAEEEEEEEEEEEIEEEMEEEDNVSNKVEEEAVVEEYEEDSSKELETTTEQLDETGADSYSFGSLILGSMSWAIIKMKMVENIPLLKLNIVIETKNPTNDINFSLSKDTITIQPLGEEMIVLTCSVKTLFDDLEGVGHYLVIRNEKKIVYKLQLIVKSYGAPIHFRKYMGIRRSLIYWASNDHQHMTCYPSIIESITPQKKLFFELPPIAPDLDMLSKSYRQITVDNCSYQLFEVKFDTYIKPRICTSKFHIRPLKVPNTYLSLSARVPNYLELIRDAPKLVEVARTGHGRLRLKTHNGMKQDAENRYNCPVNISVEPPSANMPKKSSIRIKCRIECSSAQAEDYNDSVLHATVRGSIRMMLEKNKLMKTIPVNSKTDEPLILDLTVPIVRPVMELEVELKDRLIQRVDLSKELEELKEAYQFNSITHYRINVSASELQVLPANVKRQIQNEDYNRKYYSSLMELVHSNSIKILPKLIISNKNYLYTTTSFLIKVCEITETFNNGRISDPTYTAVKEMLETELHAGHRSYLPLDLTLHIADIHEHLNIHGRKGKKQLRLGPKTQIVEISKYYVVTLNHCETHLIKFSSNLKLGKIISLSTYQLDFGSLKVGKTKNLVFDLLTDDELIWYLVNEERSEKDPFSVLPKWGKTLKSKNFISNLTVSFTPLEQSYFEREIALRPLFGNAGRIIRLKGCGTYDEENILKSDIF